MQGCRTCWRRHRCNDKDRSRGMACKDYETGEDQIKKTPVQSISKKVANKASEKDMYLDRKRGTKAAETETNHRREGDCGGSCVRFGVRQRNCRSDIDLLQDGRTVLRRKKWEE